MTSPQAESLLAQLLDMSKKEGADAADALFVDREAQSASVRLGEREGVERSEMSDLGLRVFVGESQAFVSSSDFSQDALGQIAARAVAMAKASPADQFAGLAPRDRLYGHDADDMQLSDMARPRAEQQMDMAATAEDAARAVQGVTNSEGGGASWSASRSIFATSHGFSGVKTSTSYSISASVLAQGDQGMERDYAYSAKRFLEDLEGAQDIGTLAGERAVARLNPKSLATGPMPVVYDRRVSAGIVGHLSSAINGQSVARKTSFLQSKMGEQVLASGIDIVDDPLRPRGLRSRVFDGEGVGVSQMKMVEDGTLKSWFLDSATAKQLGLETTGHASRGTSGPPSPSATNLYMANGKLTPKDLMADIETGFYVTELIGMGVNMVTGDYSRGASGFAILNGEIACPVSGLTIAGNLKDMFLNLTPSDDLEFRYGTDAPTLRIDGMVVAGEG